MALGQHSDGVSPQSSNEKPVYESDGYNNATTDAEKGTRNGGGVVHPKTGVRMNRIDKNRTKSIAGVGATGDDETDTSVSVGKQMELEAGNAIKYRTCSWYKVRFCSCNSCGSLSRAAPPREAKRRN